MSEEQAIYGLTDEQHREVSQVVIDWRTIVRPQAGVVAAKRRTPSINRVMNVDDGYPVYEPREYRKVALFVPSRDTQQTTLQMFGKDLEGDIRITIDGTTYTIDCQSTSAQVRVAIPLPASICRITVFPGTWEFAWKDTAQEITAIPYSDFYGGLLVTDELWRSQTADGEEPVLVDSIDAIPFIEGQVKRGAISLASPWGDGIYMAQYWHCPGFNFAASSV